jgi:uncharacterized protein YbaP (TraB family)
MKKATLILGVFIATCNLCAQTGQYKTGSLLWEISGKDLSKPSYLLGTFHLKSGDYLDSIPGARTALRFCEQVVGEIIMDDMAGMGIKMQQAMMMPSDTTYAMLYSDEDYRFVSEQIASLLGVGLDQLGILKPAAIQLNVVVLAYIEHLPDFDPTNVMDVRIQSEAVKEQKPVLALETVDDQIHTLFGTMSLQRQADLLLCNLKNMDESMDMISELIIAYNQGNLNDLDRLFQQQDSDFCPSTPAENDALNKDRNIAWMKKLPDMMKEKSSFIAVGALHLVGKDGLLNLLEKSGYKVEPVGM